MVLLKFYVKISKELIYVKLTCEIVEISFVLLETDFCVQRQ